MIFFVKKETASTKSSDHSTVRKKEAGSLRRITKKDMRQVC